MKARLLILVVLLVSAVNITKANEEGSWTTYTICCGSIQDKCMSGKIFIPYATQDEITDAICDIGAEFCNN